MDEKENGLAYEGDELETVTLITDDGAEEVFWHVMTFPYEGEKYAALVPEEQLDEEEPEVIFVRIERDKDGDAYVPVENEVLLGELFEELSMLLEEQDDGEGEGEGEK